MSEELHTEPIVDDKATKQEPVIDVKALQEEMVSLRQTNERILEESKQNKDKYRTLRSDVDKKESAVLEESESWKELYDREKDTAFGLSEQLQKQTKLILRKELNFQVAAEAGDAHDINDVINALPKDIISIDKESMAVNNVKEAVNLLKQKKPWLFDTKRSTGMPSGKPVSDSGIVAPSQEDALLAAIKQITN